MAGLNDAKPDKAAEQATTAATGTPAEDPPAPAFFRVENFEGPVTPVEPVDPALQAGINRWFEGQSGPHPHSDKRLWVHAKDADRARWEAMVAQGEIDAKQNIDAAMSILDGGKWPSLDDCIPKGSLLDEIDQAFVATTDIPRELPVFAAFHYVAAMLLQRGVGIEVAGEVWRPDIWTICMAESGSGKSFASSRVAKALGSGVDLFPDSSSAAKFVEDLRDHNRGLWLRDEFAQFLKSLGQDSMGDTKDYLLRCYDGATIARSTKAETVTVESPALVIYGSTVLATIKDYLTREMLVDGFAQRFAYVVAERDPRRPLKALYTFAERAPAISAMWSAILESGIESRYRVSAVGVAAFEAAFQKLVARGFANELELSFIKRITHRGVKYALVYHVLLGKRTDWLDEEDFAFGARLCALSMRDLRKVLDLCGPPKAAASDPSAVAAERLERVAAKLRWLRDLDGAAMDARVLQSSVRQLRGLPADEVRALMRQAVADDPSLAKYAVIPPARATPA